MDRQTRAHYTAIRQLHWLRVPDRITFKLPTLLLQCVNVTASGYLSSDVRPTRVADVPGRKHLHSSASSLLAIPATATDVLSVTALSSSRPPLSGTSFLETSDPPHRYLFLDAGRKLICLLTLIIAE